MERKLIDYLPFIVRDYAEMMGVMAGQQPEFERAWNAADSLLSNQFISTAEDLGLSRWEKILEITPKGTDTLEARRFRVKTRLNEELPYTYRWLVNWLQSLCGPDNPVPVVDGYTLQISLPSKADYAGILDELRRRIPANLVMVPKILLSEAKSDIFAGTAVRCVIKQQVTVMAEDDDNIMMLTDEGGKVLLSSENKILYREATT